MYFTFKKDFFISFFFYVCLQDEFISFWRIIYNLFTGMENEADMYHAAATVSTLLLKLGEVSRKFQATSDPLARSFSTLEVKSDEQAQESDQKLDKDTMRSSTVSQVNDLKSWSITFEQLIASLLTDNLLVQYFDKKYDLTQILAEYKSQHA